MVIVSAPSLSFPSFDDFVQAVADGHVDCWSLIDTGSFWVRPRSDVFALGCGALIPMSELMARFRMIPAETGLCPVRDGAADQALRQWWLAVDVWHCLFDDRASFHAHVVSRDVSERAARRSGSGANGHAGVRHAR